MVSTIGHELHKLRRAALNPFFSTQSVRKLQPVIEERVDRLLSRLYEYGKTSKEPVSIMYPFSAFTNGEYWEAITPILSFNEADHFLDVINEYAFARSDRLSMKTSLHYFCGAQLC
jgi:hypothetical protein